MHWILCSADKFHVFGRAKLVSSQGRIHLNFIFSLIALYCIEGALGGAKLGRGAGDASFGGSIQGTFDHRCGCYGKHKLSGF